ncbi:MAG: amidohydrolase [Christensenellaceae bacterium]
MNIEINHATVIVNDNNQVIKDAVLHIKDELISYVGTQENAPKFVAQRSIDAKNNIVMPGFVNMHTHVPMNLFRCYADDLELMDWLNNKIFPAEDKLTDEIAYWASMSAMCELASAGVTAFNEMYFHIDAIVRAVKKSGLRAAISRAIVTPTEEIGSRMLKESTELFEKYNNDGRIKMLLSPHAQYTVNNEMLCKIADEAKRLKTGVHMHISETRGEHDNCVAQEKMTPIELAQKCGLLDVPFFAAHCVWITQNDMDIMAEHNATVMSCPRSNLKLASGIAPLQKMLEHHVRVTLGTDGAASNNKLSMMDEMTYASFLQKGTTYDSKVIPAYQAIELATKNGAQALGLNSGELKVGKNADLIMVDSSGLRYTPDYDVVSSIVYASSDADICMTMVGGDIVYENDKCTFVDEDEVKERMNTYAKIIKEI